MQGWAFLADDGDVVDLRSCAAVLVQPGFFSFDHCVAIVETLPRVDPDSARDVVRALWDSVHRWQQTQDSPGDWSRRETAFTEIADHDVHRCRQRQTGPGPHRDRRRGTPRSPEPTHRRPQWHLHPCRGHRALHMTHTRRGGARSVSFGTLVRLFCTVSGWVGAQPRDTSLWG